MKRFKNIVFIAEREDGLQAAFELRRHTGGGPGRDGNPRQSGCTRPDHRQHGGRRATRNADGRTGGKAQWFCFTACPVTHCEFLSHASDQATVTVPLRKYGL